MNKIKIAIFPVLLMCIFSIFLFVGCSKSKDNYVEVYVNDSVYTKLEIDKDDKSISFPKIEIDGYQFLGWLDEANQPIDVKTAKFKKGDKIYANLQLIIISTIFLMKAHYLQM